MDSLGPNGTLPLPPAPFHPYAQPPLVAPPPLPRPRLWPGVVILALMGLAMLVPGWVMPEGILVFMIRMWAPMVAGAALVLSNPANDAFYSRPSILLSSTSSRRREPTRSGTEVGTKDLVM